MRARDSAGRISRCPVPSCVNFSFCQVYVDYISMKQCQFGRFDHLKQQLLYKYVKVDPVFNEEKRKELSFFLLYIM